MPWWENLLKKVETLSVDENRKDKMYKSRLEGKTLNMLKIPGCR